jgi:flagellin-like protein
MKMKSFKKHKKAVSPVLSVLLMIAVAVAASLVTYAWVMGYLGNTTGKVGRAIQIQSMAKVGSTLTVYVQNVGDGPVTLNSVYVNGILDTAGTDAFDPQILQKGDTSTVTTDFSGFGPTDIVKVKVVCTDGTFIEASGTVPGA